MSRAVRSLLLLTLLLAVAGAAAPERESRDEVLKNNQEKLDEWKKDAAHYARLKRDLERFWSRPAEERARLRKFDQELHQQEPATQLALWDALERYHAWLERLDKEARRRVMAVQGAERLAVIKELREQEYIRRLPPPLRDKVLALQGKDREKEIARLREEQKQLLQDPPLVPLGKPRLRVATFEQLPDELKAAVTRLQRLLTRPEDMKLRRASGRYPEYLQQIKQLAKKRSFALPGLDAPGPQEVWEGLRGP